MTLPLMLLHAASTLYMVGLIWFVQLVHYPLAGQVGPEAFVAYQQAHMSRTSLAVGPPMLLEVLTTAALLWARPEGVPPWALWAGAFLLAVVWASTGLLQVPQHGELLQGYDAETVARLVRGNWLRTAAWTLRGVLAVGILGWAWEAR